MCYIIIKNPFRRKYTLTVNSIDVSSLHLSMLSGVYERITDVYEVYGAPPLSSWWRDGRQITTTWVRISAWAHLKGISYLISLNYRMKSLGPSSLPCAQRWRQKTNHHHHHVCICVCMCLCACVYMWEREREREKERDRGRESYR